MSAGLAPSGGAEDNVSLSFPPSGLVQRLPVALGFLRLQSVTLVLAFAITLPSLASAFFLSDAVLVLHLR